MTQHGQYDFDQRGQPKFLHRAVADDENIRSISKRLVKKNRKSYEKMARDLAFSLIQHRNF